MWISSLPAHVVIAWGNLCSHTSNFVSHWEPRAITMSSWTYMFSIVYSLVCHFQIHFVPLCPLLNPEIHCSSAADKQSAPGSQKPKMMPSKPRVRFVLRKLIIAAIAMTCLIWVFIRLQFMEIKKLLQKSWLTNRALKWGVFPQSLLISETGLRRSLIKGSQAARGEIERRKTGQLS